MGYNANITQIEGKITSINGLAAAAINSVENRSLLLEI